LLALCLIAELRVQKYALFSYQPNYWRRNFGEIFLKFPYLLMNALITSALWNEKFFLRFPHFLDS